MRFKVPLAFVALLALTLAIALNGCSKEPTPEERSADSTLVLAKTELDKGNYNQGRQLLHSALTFDLKLNRAQPLAEEYALLGHLSKLTAEFDSAIGYFNKAITQYKSLADRTNARALLLEVASLHRQMGDERVAYAMYTEALRLSHIFNDVTGMREIQLAMLPVSRELENTEEQTQTINDLLKAYMESDNLEMQARAHYESALSSFHREEYQQVAEPLLRALTLADQARDSLFVIKILATLASAYDRAGMLQQSFETFTDALTRSDHTSGAQDLRLEMLISVGNVYLRNSQFAEAGRFYRAALSSAVVLKNRLAEGYMFIQLGHCAIGNGGADEAIKSIQNAVELFTPVNYGPGIAYANLSIGMAHQRAGRSNDALAYFKSAVEQKERCAAMPSGVYAECEEIPLQKLSYYDPLIELLLQTGRSDEAFWYAERKTEHVLFEEFNALDVQRTRESETGALFERLHHARALRIGAERQLANLLIGGNDSKILREGVAVQKKNADKILDDASSAILKAVPRLDPMVRYDGITMADVQRLLPPGTVVLRSVLTNRSLYTFAVSNAKAVVQLAAIGREHLRGLVTDYTTTQRQLVALSDSPAVQRKSLEQHIQDLSAQMYAAFIRPVEGVLAGATNVLVCPDEALTDAPIHALRKGGAAYFIEQFPVSYLPTLAMLKYKTPPSLPVLDVVGMGHPGTTSWDVEYELRDIRAFYKDVRLYFGQQASLPTLQRERGDLLHLALDLRFTSRSPENAYVLMSDVKTRGTSREILWGNLLTTPAFPTVIVSHLRADSISLDRLLPALFLVNGSSAVMVNFSPASRKAKKYFGEILYTTMLGGKPSEVAYRQALVEMIGNKDYAAPYMWAAFSLWGKR